MHYIHPSPDVKVEEFRIQKRQIFQLYSSQYVLHRWEKYWDDPDKFEPDRFLQTVPKPYTFIPFFLGPRQCIGKNFAILELKCFLCELLSRFEVERDLNMPSKQRSMQSVICFPIDNSYIVKSRFWKFWLQPTWGVTN